MGVAKARAAVAFLAAIAVLAGLFTKASADLADRSPLALQVALDRVRFSPGPIDGYLGTNTVKALRAYQRANGLEETGQPDDAVWAKLDRSPGGPALVEYVITEWDVAGPFALIPESLEEKAKLKRLDYTGPDELLAEKFHMDIELLRRLNQGRDLDRAGTRIIVANVGRTSAVKASRVEADKTIGAVLVFDSSDVNVAFFPATIGSEETPSPTGNLTIKGVARNPTYTYDPAKLNFKGVQATEVFEIQPGPNNPVGLVWIALSKPGYGIHGSPQPSGISRQRSHGCVRLTNWDALDLATMVSAGIPVEFYDRASEAEVAAIEADDLAKEPAEEDLAESPAAEKQNEQPLSEPGIEEQNERAATERNMGELKDDGSFENGVDDNDWDKPRQGDQNQRIIRYIERQHLQDRGRFADWVDYFDQGVVSREIIERDRRQFHQRWPVRHYELIPGSVEISPVSEKRYVVAFSYTYQTANLARNKVGRGEGSSSVVLHDIGGAFEVEEVKEVVYRSQ